MAIQLAASLPALAQERAGAVRPSGPSYVDALVAEALARRLDADPQWLRLGHYRPDRLGSGVHSEADGAGFFLAKDGKRSPRAELVATLRGFFQPPVVELPVGARGMPRHALCRFPARFVWLQQALQIDPARLPKQACARFVDFLREMNPASVSLIFSSYYLNNPASAFGHTFLRFNKPGLAVGERRELLDYAVDFSADVDTPNAVLYAFKGVFGLFPGTAKRMPYYYKVRKYADHESRDIWEYELELTPMQIYMLVAHVWELGSTYFAYYYIDENCSYRINMMLEVARPDVVLVEPLTSPVLPADTVKVLFDNPGLVRSVKYRPSLRTQFRHAVRDLDGDTLDAVEDLAHDAEAPLPAAWSDARRVQALDTAVDLLDVRHVKDLVLGADTEAAEHKRRVLERRAAIPVPSDQDPIEPPWDRAPERGHDSKRVGLSGGMRDDESGFAVLDVRLAMHDLADPSEGYPELAQLEFFPTRLRVRREGNGAHLSLDDFALVRVVSLTGMNRFDLSLSWRIEGGARTLEAAGCDECLVGELRGGVGPAAALAGDALTLFALFDVRFQAGPEVSGIAESAARGGFGPSGGVRLRFDPRLVMLLTGEWMWFPEQRDTTLWQTDAVLRWSFVPNHALSLEGRARAALGEAQLFYLHYF